MFHEENNKCCTNKCKLEYLPVVPFPPKDNVILWYMDAILQMVDDLAINHVFVHADEAINSTCLSFLCFTKESMTRLSHSWEDNHGKPEDSRK